MIENVSTLKASFLLLSIAVNVVDIIGQLSDVTLGVDQMIHTAQEVIAAETVRSEKELYDNGLLIKIMTIMTPTYTKC